MMIFTRMMLVNNNKQIKIIYIYNNYNNKPNDDDNDDLDFDDRN